MGIIHWILWYKYKQMKITLLKDFWNNFKSFGQCLKTILQTWWGPRDDFEMQISPEPTDLFEKFQCWELGHGLSQLHIYSTCQNNKPKVGRFGFRPENRPDLVGLYYDFPRPQSSSFLLASPHPATRPPLQKDHSAVSDILVWCFSCKFISMSGHMLCI